MRSISPQSLPWILEYEWRRLAFFLRVPLEDLAIMYPPAQECGSKAEFLAPQSEELASLSKSARRTGPREVERLSLQFHAS